jgi:hypothetical protein
MAMDLFSRERSRGRGTTDRLNYAQALQDQAYRKASVALATAGDKTEAEATKDTDIGQGIIGATKTYESVQKVKDRLSKNKLVSAVADRAGQELESRAPNLVRQARRVGSAIDGGVRRVSSLTSGAGGGESSAGAVDAGASSAVREAVPTPRPVPDYIRAGDPRLASMSPAEVEANTRARVQARENMTANIRDRLRARTGTASRDLTGLTGGDADRQQALDQVRRTLGGGRNPPTTNPHASAPTDDPASRLQPNTGRPFFSGEEDAGTPTTRPQVLAGAGEEAEEGASMAGKVLSGVGEAMDFLGPIGDLIGIGLSIFGVIESGKATAQKEQAQQQAEAMANKPVQAPVGKAVGATLDTARAMAPTQVHF